MGAFVEWRRVALVAGAGRRRRSLAVPLFVGEFTVHVLAISAYYVILAASWNMLAGFTGQFSLAQHGFAARRRLYVGAARLSSADAAVGQHSGRRSHRGRARRLSAGPSRAAHAHDLSVDCDLGFRGDAAHLSRPRPMSSRAAIWA